MAGMLRSRRLRRPTSRTLRTALAVLLVSIGGAIGASAPATAAPLGTPMSASLLGEQPMGAGVFRFPQGVAVEPATGNVFVADQYSGVIQAFDGNGTPLFQFGARALRREPGRLGVIGGIAADRSGHLWVLDSENDRIQVFSTADGRYLASFGDRGQFSLSNYGTRPDAGIAAGGLVVAQASPASSVIVWVADSGNDRLLRYVFNPQTLRPHGPPRVSDRSSAPLSRPQGVGISPDGRRIYAPDNRNHRIYVLDSRTLERISVFGAYGTGPGQFASPYDAAVDAGSPSQLYTADNLNGRVNVFDAATLQYSGTFGGNGREVGRFSIVRAVTSNPLDQAGGVWVADTSNNRIQRVSRTGEIVAAWGIHGRGAGYFTRPRGVAFHPDGRLMVADTFDSRIALFSPDGTYEAQYGRVSRTIGHTVPGSKSGELLLPSAVTVDRANITWVADSYNNRLVQYSPSGGVLTTTRAGGIRRPTGLATGSDGSVYVASSFSNRIVRFRSDGSSEIIRTKINRPSAVAVQATGRVFATSLRTVIDVLTNKRIPAPGGGTIWDRPQGIAAADDGTLYVSELRPATANGSRIVRGAPDGNGGYVWETIATEGTGLGQVLDPANLALSPDQRTLLVADAGNNRIQRLDAPGSAPPVTQPLRVTVDGGPLRGTVTSNPPGIDCGTDCSQFYGGSRPVILTATARKNFVFAGWDGACAAAGQERRCAVTTEQAKDVIARFVPVPPPPVRIRALSVSPTRWHLTRKPSPTRRTLASRQATRARLAIQLNEPGTGRLEVLQARPGRTVGRGRTARCVKAGTSSRVPSNRRCTRFVALPSATRTLRLLEGRTVAELTPRIGRRTLTPGRYRLRLTVRDAAGNSAVRETGSITLTR